MGVSRKKFFCRCNYFWWEGLTYYCAGAIVCEYSSVGLLNGG